MNAEFYFLMPIVLILILFFYFLGNLTSRRKVKNLKLQIRKLEESFQTKESNFLKTHKQLEEFSDKLFVSYSQLSNLDSLIRDINNQTELSKVLETLQVFLRTNYNIPHFVLYILDHKSSHLKFHSANFPDFLSDRQKYEISSRSIEISDKTATIYAHGYVWKRKRAYFVKDMNNFDTKGVEAQNKETVNLKSLLILPLNLRNKFIGTLDLLDFSQTLNLTKQEVEQIKIIADYVAGSIESSFLLQELGRKNQRIEEEKILIEKNRKKIEKLNQFIKNINAVQEIDDILTEIYRYFIDVFSTGLGLLLLVDSKSNQLFPAFAKEDVFHNGIVVKSILKNFKAPLEPSTGSLYRVFSKKKAFYLNQLSYTDFPKDSIDRFITENFQLKSIVQIPLVVQNETIGIFCFRANEVTVWSREDFKDMVFVCDQLAGAVNNANLRNTIAQEKEKTMQFLRNILPGDLAQDLMVSGEVIPMEYESATILFTDFKNFTKIAETLSPEDLIEQLDACFSQFDQIADRHSFEKLKTIGDSYMAAGGLPQGNFTHPVDACLFAMEVQAFMDQIKQVKQILKQSFWEIRIGIHTGPVVAGVVGRTKFAYDVWGDTVNIASRMESSGEAGEINLSEVTYEKVKRFFVCEYRGKISAKNKGEMGMYYLRRIKPEFSRDPEGRVPNSRFQDLYENLKIGAKILWKEAI